MNKKILILGEARHGKDTLAELLGLPFKSSSEAALEIFLYDELNDFRIANDLRPYSGHTEAFKDRVNHREFWHHAIRRYNTPDRARLAREILEENQVYVGMRWDEEYYACLREELFDVVLWVDASKRKPLEGKESMNIEYDSDTMIWVNNNGDLAQLKRISKKLLKKYI